MTTERSYALLADIERLQVAEENDSEPGPDLVEAINEGGAAAWPGFIQHYSPFILSCIRRYARDHDERMEIYVYVCSRLCDDDCRRIRQYRGAGDFGTCKFSTWLAAVIFNLSREWIRSARGRRRLFRAVKRLGRIDRLIFRYYFWEGYTLSQIARMLRSKEHLDCSVPEVIRRLAGIERRLTRDHRWRLVTTLLRSAAPISLDRSTRAVGEERSFDLPDEREDMGLAFGRGEAHAALQELIDALPDDERLAVRLRFERGLSAKEIAAAMGISNYKRIYDIQGKALSRLESGLRERGLEFSDFVDSKTGTASVEP